MADLRHLHLQDADEDVERLFDSPEARSTTPKDPLPSKQTMRMATTSEQQPASSGRNENTPVARQQALETELAQLRQMNSTIEGLNQSLTTAIANLQTMQTNMDTAKTLLKTWSRILSQAEHNQRLILDSRWQGATKDLEDIANDDLRRQAEAQRKIQEENARREAAQRRQEDEQRRREADEVKKTRGMSRTRSVRGSGPSSTTSTRGSASTTTMRGRGGATRGSSSGIARGGSLRARGRG